MNKEIIVRQSGFYWVYYENEWMPLYWNSRFQKWSAPYQDEYTLQDSELLIINENRLEKK